MVGIQTENLLTSSRIPLDIFTNKVYTIGIGVMVIWPLHLFFYPGERRLLCGIYMNMIENPVSISQILYSIQEYSDEFDLNINVLDIRNYLEESDLDGWDCSTTI